jgi:predicted RNase H-like nuclease
LCVEVTDDTCAAEVHENVHSIWQRYDRCALILIDVPIGLWDQGSRHRRCERDARKVLGQRRSSVFTPPLRSSLSYRSYPEASRHNCVLSGRKLSKQAWGIASKIDEVDAFLRHCDGARGILRETHPEVCFWSLNGREAMAAPKKSVEGRRSRHQLLSRHTPFVDDVYTSVRCKYRRAEVADDDIYDALVAAVTAQLFTSGRGATLPDIPEFDSFGLPMEMVYAL